MQYIGSISDHQKQSQLIESEENIQIVSRYMKWKRIEERYENARLFLSMISQENSNHPYHNSRHAYRVAEYAKEIFQKRKESRPSHLYPEILLFQLFVAERGHDIRHPGRFITQQDEEESASIMKKILMDWILESEKLKNQICETVEHLIINGTKFEWRNPVLNTLISQDILLKIMKDADILYLGDTYEVFLDGSIRYAVEQMEGSDFSEESLKKTLNYTIGEFRETILKRNKLDRSPFYMIESQTLYPNFNKNMTSLKEQLESRLGFGELVRRAKIIYDTYYVKSPL